MLGFNDKSLKYTILEGKKFYKTSFQVSRQKAAGLHRLLKFLTSVIDHFILIPIPVFMLCPLCYCMVLLFLCEF